MPSQTNSNAAPTTKEEADNLSRSTKKVKTGGPGGDKDRAFGVEEDVKFEERRKSSYRDKVMGLETDVSMEGNDSDAFGDASDNDVIEDDYQDGPWISLGMTKEEKKQARKPWRFSLIIKLVGCSIGY